MSLYSQRGVSAQKEDVHKATEKLDKGLYPHAFCKIYQDYLTGDDNWVNIMHADGAGTKSILAYMYWKETGDVSVWKGIAQDAIAMNLDDLLCVGIYDKLLFSSTIDRNKNVIPAEVLSEIINASEAFFEEMEKFGVNIHYLGGETADVGDLVRTIAVNGTMTGRWKKEKLVTNEKIAAGDVIVGLASSGQAVYEKSYNSGIGSNGLTSARHDVLDKSYARNFPETFEPSLDNKVVYIGSKKLQDDIAFNYGEKTVNTSIGALLLSPTRTYAPFVRQLLDQHFESIHGLIHCSGGGQTKCMKYLHRNFKIVKDNLFLPPEIFRIIQQSSGADNREMYQVFNMGHRLEVFTDEASADAIIKLANSFDIEAQVVGRVEAADRKELLLKSTNEEITFVS
jgi:phosphoribosylformylglycinamidine cyclo-ligase